MGFDDDAPVRPDGLTIRRLRRHRGWSRSELSAAIARRSREASGRAESVSPNLLQGIEEANERVPYATLCLISLGLDCNPVELLGHDAATNAPNGL
jgi:transcriptional regulator with XRE-family HTH domain